MMPTAVLKPAVSDVTPSERVRWLEAFRRVRGETERRAAPLSPEDQTIQSMADTSPTKWHRAHTTWLTDILHAFAQNPTNPVYDPNWQPPRAAAQGGYAGLPEGIHTVGHQGEGYCFDNEEPSHRALVGPVRIARSLVTNGEWLAFMKD